MARKNISSTDFNRESTRVQLDWITTKLESAEKSGFTQDTKQQLLAQSKSLLND